MPPSAFGFGGPAARSAAEVLGEQDNSTFSNVLRFLGRPGFAFRSLITGEVTDAAENLAQMALDLPTGGFIDRDLSLANFFSSSGDITDAGERPEFTDVLHRYGGVHPGARGFGSRLALDVFGGIVTDPLTLLGGTGAARSVTAGALKGLGRVKSAQKIGSALRNTPLGTMALQSSADNVYRTTLAGFNKKLAAAETAGNLKAVKAIRENRIFQTLNESLKRAPFTSPALRETLDVKAVERVFFDGLAQGNPAKVTAASRLSESLTMSNDLSEGIRALEKAGKIPNAGALHWRIPFTETYGKIPGTDNFWSKVGNWGTAPGWARMGLHKFEKTKPLAQLVDNSATQLKDLVTRDFYDRASGAAKLVSKAIPEGLKNAFRSASSEMWAYRRTKDAWISRYAGQFTKEQAEQFGGIWDEVQDLYRAGSLTEDAAKTRLLEQMISVSPGKEEAVKQVVEGIMTGHQEMVDDLVRLGVWSKKDANPFYLPRQMSTKFRTLLDESLSPGVDKQFRQAMKDVYTKPRQFQTLDDFNLRLEEIAKKFGVDTTGMDPQQRDLFSLFRDRTFAHSATVAKAKAYNKAKKLVRAGAAQDPLNQYLRYQFEPLGMRESILTKTLGGGTFRIPADGRHSAALREWAEKSSEKFFKKSLKDGFVEIEWPGLNHFVKPSLTVVNPKFHVRNAVSTFFMAAFDPEMAIGLKGHAANLKNVWDSLHDAFYVRLLGKSGYAGGEIADFMKILDNPTAVKGEEVADLFRLNRASRDMSAAQKVVAKSEEAAAALERLRASGKTIGPYTIDETLEVLRSALGPGVETGGADLMTRLSEADVLGREIANNGPRAKVAWNRLMTLTRDMAQIAETRTRARQIIHLLSRGVEKEEVLKRVGDAFVDYSLNSTTERALRDIIPFAKFTMGSTKWIKSIANRPALVNWMGRVRGNSETEFLPERAEDSMALPLPWLDAEGNRQYLIGLGLPQETVLNIMGVVTPKGFRRQVLGSLQPQVKLPLEAVTDRNFYFGDRFGKFRKAPNWMPEAWTTEVELPGGAKRYEINGNINELLNALPTAAFDGAMNRFFDERRSLINRAVNNLTGVRTMSVDTERELKIKLQEYLKDKARSGQVGETLVYFDRMDAESMPEDLKIILSTLKGLKKRKKKQGLRSGFGF